MPLQHVSKFRRNLFFYIYFFDEFQFIKKIKYFHCKDNNDIAVESVTGNHNKYDKIKSRMDQEKEKNTFPIPDIKPLHNP